MYPTRNAVRLFILATLAVQGVTLLLPTAPADGATSCYASRAAIPLGSAAAPTSYPVSAITTMAAPHYLGMTVVGTGVCANLTFVCNQAMNILYSNPTSHTFVLPLVQQAPGCSSNASSSTAPLLVNNVTYTTYIAFSSTYISTMLGALAGPVASNQTGPLFSAALLSINLCTANECNWLAPSPPPFPAPPPPPSLVLVSSVLFSTFLAGLTSASFTAPVQAVFVNVTATTVGVPLSAVIIEGWQDGISTSRRLHAAGLSVDVNITLTGATVPSSGVPAALSTLTYVSSLNALMPAGTPTIAASRASVAGAAPAPLGAAPATSSAASSIAASATERLLLAALAALIFLP